MNNDNNKLEAEEIDGLLDKGIEISVGKKKFLIHKPYLGTLDALSELYLKMEIDQEQLENNTISEINVITKKSARLLARVVAIAILNGRWKIKILSGPLSRYIYWRLTPDKLLTVIELILQLRDVQSFITSIRLSAGARTTKPNLIEQNKQA